MYATVRGKCDVVTELISLGADVDIQDNVSCLHCLIMTLASGSALPECTVCLHMLKSVCLHLSHGNANVFISGKYHVKQITLTLSAAWKLSTDTSSQVGLHRHCYGAVESRSQVRPTRRGTINHTYFSK